MNGPTRIEKLISLSERQNHRCAYCTFTMWLPLLDVPFTTGRSQTSLPAPQWRRFCFSVPALRVIVPIVRNPAVGDLHWPHAVKGRMATPDHLVPKVRGGIAVEDNLVVACFTCNSTLKGEWTAEYATAAIARRLRKGDHPHQVYEETGLWMASRAERLRWAGRAWRTRAATSQASPA